MPKDTQVNELERCRPWIEAALEYSGGTHEFEDVAKGIVEGRMQLWPSPRGCIVTEIVVYPKKKTLNVFLGGGELDQLLDMHSDCLLYTSPSPRDQRGSRMPSSA